MGEEERELRVGRARREQIAIGDLVVVYPVHPCLTSSLRDHCLTLEGERIARLPGCRQPDEILPPSGQEC